MQPIRRLVLRITHYPPPPPPTFSTIHQIHTTSLHPKNHIIYNYLINTFNFPKARALKWSNRFAKVQTTEKPESVVNYFKSLGFTNTQITSSATLHPTILFSHIDRTIKPKIQFFQELGISGPNLGELISKNSPLLGHSLNKKLKPAIEIIKNVLAKHDVKDVNDSLFKVLKRSWIINAANKQLLANVDYLERCGVSGCQLARILVHGPMLVSSSESELKFKISRALDLGFSVDSRMFMHGLLAVNSISDETLLSKLKLFKSFGFTDDEFKEMVKGSPNILTSSEDKLRFGVGFYLETVGLKKLALVDCPVCLLYDMRNRVVPRYKVVTLLKRKGILKKENRFTCLVKMSELKFVEKYITRFSDHAEELLDAYTGHLVDSSGSKQPILK